MPWIPDDPNPTNLRPIFKIACANAECNLTVEVHNMANPNECACYLTEMDWQLIALNVETEQQQILWFCPRCAPRVRKQLAALNLTLTRRPPLAEDIPSAPTKLGD